LYGINELNISVLLLISSQIMSDEMWQRSWASQKGRLKGRRYRDLIPQLDSNLSGFQTCVKQLSDQYGAKSVSKQLLGFDPYLAHLDSFSKCIGTMVQSNPQVAALVWGGTQILIVVRKHHFR
jgi:hypothetical protein